MRTESRSEAESCKVMIGQAAADEHGKAKNGAAGDQNGKEVSIREWYDRKEGWECVIRAEYDKTAEAIAAAMEQACQNDHIGYDQAERKTIWAEARKHSFDLSAIVTDCECDCSSLVGVCVYAAGIEVSQYIYTGNMRKLLEKTKRFKVIDDPDYLTSPDRLKRGDILLGSGHCAVVLTDGCKSSPEDSKDDRGAFCAFVVRIVKDVVMVHAGPGESYKITTVVHKGDAYTIVDVSASGRWGKLKSGAGWIDLDCCKRK